MFSIYDLIREADGDENAQGNTGDAGAAEAAPDAGGDDTATNDAGGDDNQDDDEFNMDASLDDDGAEGGDDAGGGDDTGDDAGSDDLGGGGSSEGEEDVVDNNTNIFDSLTAEEQQIKIRELKNQYKELYSSTDDLIDRLSNFCADESNYHVINKVSDALRRVRQYLGDYFVYTFPTKTFIENDIMYNEFLYIVSRISSVLEKFAKQVEEEDEK